MWTTVCKTASAALGVLAVAGALTGAAILYGGLYDINATSQHLQPTYSLLEQTMRSSVQRSARDLVVPAGIDSPQTLQRGALCYRQHCMQCHGGPGVARAPFSMAMQPVPAPLIDAVHNWRLRELYWITRHGIKMSGMPAWQLQLDDDDLWAVAAFVARLHALSPADYAERMAQAAGGQCIAPQAAGGAEQASPERGKAALYQYACHACHTIPGITGPNPQVGPPLAGIATQALIAGRLANTHDNMVAWIRDPQRFDAKTAMPDHGVGARDAHDMAAYLATLR